MLMLLLVLQINRVIIAMNAINFFSRLTRLQMLIAITIVVVFTII